MRNSRNESTISTLQSLGAWAAIAASALLILIGVHYATRSSNFLPTPWEVCFALYEIMSAHEFLRHLGASLSRVVLGLAGALICGVTVAGGLSLCGRAAMLPLILVNLIRPIPPIAWIPLAISLFGLSSTASVAIIFIGAFFPIFTATHDGIRQVDAAAIARAKLLGADWKRVFTNVIVPSVLSSLFTGFRTALGFAWMCVVASEMIAARSGFGYALQLSRQLLRLDHVVAYMLIIGVVGAIMVAVMNYLSNFLLPWKRPSQVLPQEDSSSAPLSFAETYERLRKLRGTACAVGVEGEGMTFSYGTKGENPVLHNVSFRISAGEKVSILGASGSGKSTLAALAAGLSTPTEGAILVDRGGPNLGATRIAMVFQGAPLFPALTALHNVAFGIVSLGMEREQALKLARQLLSSLGLGGRAHAFPSELSGGERQRVALLQAVAYLPQLIILDEAFAALDNITGEQLQEDLSVILALTGVTTLIITHDIGEAVFLSERVMILSRDSGLREASVISAMMPRRVSFRSTMQFQSAIVGIRAKLDPVRAAKNYFAEGPHLSANLDMEFAL